MPYDNRQQRTQQKSYPQQHPEETTSTLQISIKFDKPLDAELFNSKALEAARAIAANEKCNKSSQLRRFYDELVSWETRVNRYPEKFEEYLPFIRMINAKAAYAKGRNLVDHNFVELMRQTLGEVKNPESLTASKLFWEAFMGFYK